MISDDLNEEDVEEVEVEVEVVDKGLTLMLIFIQHLLGVMRIKT